MIDYCENTNAIIASVIGRYYAMDRDNRWDRTKKAYRLLVEGLGNNSKNLNKTIVESYSKGITDEFIEPVTLGNAEEVEKSRITENDVVIFFNFRTDRGRQLTYALTQKKIDDYGMTPLSLHLLTMTNYDDSFKNINIIYKKEKPQYVIIAQIRYLTNFPISINTATITTFVLKNPSAIAIGSPKTGSQHKNAKIPPQLSIFFFHKRIFFLFTRKYFSIVFQLPILPIK